MKTTFTQTAKNIATRSSLVLAFATIVNLCDAQVCANPSTTIYALSNAGAIYPVTVSTAHVGSAVNSTLYNTSTSANSIGYNNVNGLFYFFQVALSGAKTFVSYNPTNNTYATLAASSIPNTVNRGCVNFDGTGYYCLDNSGILYYYSIAANTWATIGSTFKDQLGNNATTVFSSLSSGDMAIDGYGNLWIVASNAADYALYELAAPLPTAAVAGTITVTRKIASTATPAGVQFTGVAFDPSGNMYMATTTDLYVMKGGMAITHIAALSTLGISGDLTSCSYPYTVLPVNWVNFAVAPQDNKSVSISWEVSQQLTDKGYYVERSIDGSNWDQLGFVANTANNDNTIAQYSFSDNQPLSGKNYYRICQVDMDGKESYSEIRTVNIEVNTSNTVSVWPNPATASIHIQNNNENGGTARIYSLSGSLISENKIQPGVNTINVGSLSIGMYVVAVQTADGQSYTKKFIKQ